MAPEVCLNLITHSFLELDFCDLDMDTVIWFFMVSLSVSYSSFLLLLALGFQIWDEGIFQLPPQHLLSCYRSWLSLGVKRILDAHSNDWKFPNQEHTRLTRKPIVLISSSHAACKFMDNFMIL
ncbi:hypothetical protein RHGRI_023884 [Rhododendron griersonianum]|uniref:Uncharacterized protein n=1 Tax=Rhododendron griersonianum TaxID=479676 RepID=A0AAV6J8Y2_9ERIC|nr:hypothetical protein RHGRI_023884 [Rhododendron griersonianum]